MACTFDGAETIVPVSRTLTAGLAGTVRCTAADGPAHVPRRPPHVVALQDEYERPLDLDAPADLVGITCNTPNATHVYALADAFRARGRIVVLGGPHATLLPDEAKAHADAVVVGEAETTWPRLPGWPIPGQAPHAGLDWPAFRRRGLRARIAMPQSIRFSR